VDSRICHLTPPFGRPTRSDNPIDELFHTRRPVFYPLYLTTHRKRTTSPFPLEGAYLIRTDTLGQPDRSCGGDVLAKALIE